MLENTAITFSLWAQIPKRTRSCSLANYRAAFQRNHKVAAAGKAAMWVCAAIKLSGACVCVWDLAVSTVAIDLMQMRF